MNEHQKTIATWNKLSKAYENKFMDLAIYNHTYDAFCKSLPLNTASVLELGCGPGNITRYLLQKRPDLNVLATDAAPTMVELAQHNNPKAICQVLDALDLHTLPGKFNGIMCGFILPYLDIVGTEKLIHDAEPKLLPNGILYLSFIEGDYATSAPVTNSLGDTLVVYKHESKKIESLLQEYHFTLLQKFDISYSVGDKTEIHTVILANKQKDYLLVFELTTANKVPYRY